MPLPTTRKEIYSKHTKGNKNNKKAFLDKKCIRIGIYIIFLIIICYLIRYKWIKSYSIKYAIVLDAGSTGTRIHIYKFNIGQNGYLMLLNDDFHHIKPGLSHYAHDPKLAADSLKPLISHAFAAVPMKARHMTKCELRATAGLRLLSENVANNIIREVYNYLKETPFLVSEDSVTILDGQKEGAYAWLTLNFLLDKLGNEYDETAASIDLGGGSIQKAYALPTDFTSPLDGYVIKLEIFNRSYSVYVKSYLNFGLMAARAEIMKRTGNDPNPCFKSDLKAKFMYNDLEMNVVGSNYTTYDVCAAMITKIMQARTPCRAPPRECSFHGVWDGPGVLKTQEYYLFSYIWDTASDAQIIKDNNGNEGMIRMDLWKKKAQKICSMKKSDLIDNFPQLKEADLAFLCMDMTYIDALLTNGLKINRKNELKTVKKIKNNGQYYETAWTLGAALCNMDIT